MAANSMKDTPCGPAVRDEQPKPNGSGEIAITDCLEVLWKRKTLILTATVMSALSAVILLRLLPQQYQLKYAYNTRDSVNLDANTYSHLLRKFYSEDNLTGIKSKLQECGLSYYVDQIEKNPGKLFTYLSFQTSPKLLRISNPSTDIFDTQEISKGQKASSLQVAISCQNEKELRELAAALKENVECQFIFNLIQAELADDIKSYEISMAQIEKNRFLSQHELQMSANLVSGLKKLAENTSSNQILVVQFNFKDPAFDFLFANQLASAEYSRAKLENRIKFDEAKHEYYADLQVLNYKILAELENRCQDYTMDQFRCYLNSLAEQSDVQSRDYLSSYIREIETKMLSMEPIVQNPPIATVPKNIARKAYLTSISACSLFVLIAFLWEGCNKKK